MKGLSAFRTRLTQTTTKRTRTIGMVDISDSTGKVGMGVPSWDIFWSSTDDNLVMRKGKAQGRFSIDYDTVRDFKY